MKALCWYGKNDVRVETVPDPKIINPHDAIVKITSTAICGSDLHLYDGYIPTLQKGDILGHNSHRLVVIYKFVSSGWYHVGHARDNCGVYKGA